MKNRLLFLIQDFFGISLKEARGILVLMLLCLVGAFVPSLMQHWVYPSLWPPRTTFEAAKADSLFALLTQKQPSNTTEYADRSSSDYGSERVEAQLRPFDPNTASAEELQSLGLPTFLANRIVNYRNKGGRFRRTEDVKRIYGLSEDTYLRLAPYIRISSQAAEAATSPPETKQIAEEQRPRAALERRIVPFDLNRADTTQLKQLKGIGSVLSVRILRYRDALGGFHSPSQYAEIYGLDSTAQAELKRYALLQTPVNTISLNTATVEQLRKHPYLRDKRLSELIVRYREQNGSYKDVEDLRKIKLMDEVTFQRIRPYLSVVPKE